MSDQEAGGAPAPVTDAPATQAPETTEVETKLGSEADSSPAAPESEKPAKPAKTGEQIRIDELTRRLREAERRNDRLLRVYEERETAPQPQQQQPRSEPEKPKGLKDFNYDETKYAEYLIERTSTTALERARQKTQQEQEAADANSRSQKWNERLEAFAQEHPEVFDDWNSTPVSKGMAQALEGSDEGPAIFAHLKANKELAKSLAKLHPFDAARELGRIEERLVSERKKAAQKPVSNAPPPAPKIEGSGAAGVVGKPDTADGDALSDAEWTRRRNSQEQARLRKSRGG